MEHKDLTPEELQVGIESVERRDEILRRWYAADKSKDDGCEGCEQTDEPMRLTDDGVWLCPKCWEECEEADKFTTVAEKPTGTGSVG